MNEKKLSTPLKITVFHKDQIALENTFESYPITIGRSHKCDVPLSQFEFLSRQHCVVSVEHGKIQVLDLESANGIYFEGQKVKKALIDRDVTISVGEIKIRFELVEATVMDSSEVTKTSGPKVFPSEIPSFKQDTYKQAKPETIVSQKETVKTQVNTKPKIPEAGLTSSAKQEQPVKIETKKKHTPPRTNPVDVDGGLSVIKPHHHASQLRPNQRVLESFVTWKDQIYESQVFHAGSQVIIGHGENVNVEVPTLKFALPLAFYDGNNTQCVIPQNLHFSIRNESGFLEKQDVIQSGQGAQKNNSVSLKMGPSDVVSVDLGPNMAVHFRYAPAPRQLSRDIPLLNDPELKKTTLISGIAHFALLITILLTEPKSKTPVIKNVPERYARLLVKKPEPPKPLPPPPKKPEPPKPKEVAKREPPKKQPTKPQPVVKRQPKQTKVVKVQPSKILKRVNRYPVEVDRPMKPAEKPVVSNIQAVGALAALNAFSSKAAVSNQPVAININKDAGGQTALNTGGVIGTLKTNTGKLAAGGLASVKTKGLGYGTGTGYGVQGIKGTAGGRAVAGTVVGAPSLVRLSKEDGLTRQQVMDVVKRYMGEIQQCYERSLIDNPNISGRIEYEWEISSKGAVQWAKVKKSETAGADGLNNCVTGVFKKMKFPVAKNGQNTIPNIGFPFGRL